MKKFINIILIFFLFITCRKPECKNIKDNQINADGTLIYSIVDRKNDFLTYNKIYSYKYPLEKRDYSDFNSHDGLFDIYVIDNKTILDSLNSELNRNNLNALPNLEFNEMNYLIILFNKLNSSNIYISANKEVYRYEMKIQEYSRNTFFKKIEDQSITIVFQSLKIDTINKIKISYEQKTCKIFD